MGSDQDLDADNSTATERIGRLPLIQEKDDVALVRYSPEENSATGIRPEESSANEVNSKVLDESMTQLDWKYWRSLYQHRASDPLGRRVLSVTIAQEIKSPHRKSVTIVLPWPQFPVSSKPFRYAALTFASALAGNKMSHDTCFYLSRFYKYTREAIAASSLVEVAVASYAILLFHYSAADSFDHMFIHFEGICERIIHIQDRIFSDNLDFLRELWESAFQAMQRVIWAGIPATWEVTETELQKLFKVFSITRNMSFIEDGPDEDINDLTKEQRHARLDFLECLLAFYLDYYLALKTYSDISKNSAFITLVGDSLRDVIRQIIRTMRGAVIVRSLLGLVTEDLYLCAAFDILPTLSEQPNLVLPAEASYDDVKAALLFGWARLLNDFLIPVTTEPHDSVCSTRVTSSVVLWRLCRMAFANDTFAQHPSGLSLTRALFWIGLSITKRESPFGKTFHVD